VQNRICIWYRSLGKIGLKGHDPILCPNCKGSGKGRDGGRSNITTANKDYMKGNEFHWPRKVKN